MKCDGTDVKRLSPLITCSLVFGVVCLDCGAEIVSRPK
jgi:hypothetical protein